MKNYRKPEFYIFDFVAERGYGLSIGLPGLKNKNMNKTAVKQSCTNALHPFVHLHTHTEYSLSDGLGKIPQLVDKAMADGMAGIAITDHANMFGVKEFVEYVQRRNSELGTSFKPIIGCEVYVARRGKEHKNERGDWGGHHLVLLAKNETGYRNLLQIVSRSWLEGYFGRPRTDKADLERYHEGLICTSACIGGEVAQHILNNRLGEAEKAAKWYQTIFGEDYYLELQRHKATAKRASFKTYELEERANKHLRKIAKKLGIKLVCANDIHFVNEEDGKAQDTLLCISFGAKVYDTDRLIFSQQEWLKTTAEMNALFSDIPEALESTMEILNKVELYPIDHAPMLPAPHLPDGVGESEHLAHLALEGAHLRYGETLTEEVKARLDQELSIIEERGFATYILLWHEIVSAARQIGAQVGPGRGWSAGSVVLYCLGITQVDPLKYGLSAERFLNPVGLPLPNIDVDFDEEGRERLLQWLVERFGEECVANVVAPHRSSPNSSKLLVAQAYGVAPSELKEQELAIAQKIAEVARRVNVHACGVAICSEDISYLVPLAFVEDPNYEKGTVVTQYCGEGLRRAGVVVLNLLSLKALDIVKYFAQELGVAVESIPLDDETTFELLRRGETEGLFQFDSEEMRQYLREEQPSDFEGLVAILSHHCTNRAHAVSYALLAYQVAYLKAHYPESFACAVSR